jgi:DNA invertase Pin-like site-specific DNA recombinase
MKKEWGNLEQSNKRLANELKAAHEQIELYKGELDMLEENAKAKEVTRCSETEMTLNTYTARNTFLENQLHQVKQELAEERNERRQAERAKAERRQKRDEEIKSGAYNPTFEIKQLKAVNAEMEKELKKIREENARLVGKYAVPPRTHCEIVSIDRLLIIHHLRLLVRVWRRAAQTPSRRSSVTRSCWPRCTSCAPRTSHCSPR